LNIPKNIKLADPYFDEPQHVDLVLGADVFHDLLSVGQIKLDNNLPTLQKTLLGLNKENNDALRNHLKNRV